MEVYFQTQEAKASKWDDFFSDRIWEKLKGFLVTPLSLSLEIREFLACSRDA